jgi:asparagine synthase (glutamine-hydrolysing)
MKQLLRDTFSAEIPREVLDRRDKMGFPVPLNEWFAGELKDLLQDVLHSLAVNDRPFINGKVVDRNRSSEQPFSRRTWGLLSLELWYQEFHDRASEWRRMVGR